MAEFEDRREDEDRRIGAMGDKTLSFGKVHGYSLRARVEDGEFPFR